MTPQPEEWARGEETARRFFKQCPPPDAKWFVEESLIPILKLEIATALRQTAERAAEREREKIKQLIDAARAVDLWHSKQEKSDLYLSAEFMQLYKALHEICSGQP